MLKSRKTLMGFLLLELFFTNCFLFFPVEQKISLEKKTCYPLSSKTSPKSSGYTIEEKWNYTSTALDDIALSLDGNYLALLH
ncbi:MAG: hypothetical protein GF353_15705 [Candidatus Lokiarchaeota archaeon]|nr:hypothetical protein [Candidatus Lokiarchaeota archaeon]